MPLFEPAPSLRARIEYSPGFVAAESLDHVKGAAQRGSVRLRVEEEGEHAREREARRQPSGGPE